MQRTEAGTRPGHRFAGHARNELRMSASVIDRTYKRPAVR